MLNGKMYTSKGSKSSFSSDISSKRVVAISSGLPYF